MTHPNLFTYATSELSQDAMICWLLSWASPECEPDQELHKCAKAFIHALFDKHSKEAPPVIKKVEVFKQDKNIDVLCIINEKYAFIIEDKTGTKNHSDQLVRYLEDIKKRKDSKGKEIFLNENILPIYYKTEDQSNYRNVENDGYKPFLRADIIELLQTYNGRNAILLDYRDHLKSISDKTESYSLLPIEKWDDRNDRYPWVGFYLKLQEKLGTGNWDYVANPNGGFLGFRWHFQGDKNICRQYLQLEEKKFCFKIEVKDSKDRRSKREKWHKIIQSKGQELDLPLKKPDRFGNGKYMTVNVFDGEYRECSDGLIDIGKTVSILKQAGKLLEAVSENV